MQPFSTRLPLTRWAASATLALGASGAGGCFSGGVAYVEAEDVQVEPVRSTAFRAAGAAEYGDVYVIGMQGAHDVNGWVGAGIEAVGTVIRKLDRFPASSTDGDWRVYGPARDLQGRNLSWMVKISGDEEAAGFEAWVGRRGADEGAMSLLLAGEIAVEDSRRSGQVMIDFDVIEAYGDELKTGPQVDQTYTGKVDIAFVRDLDTEFKHVDLEYQNFTVTQEIPVPDYFSATTYAFHREDDGSGDFRVELAATFQALLWSGPEVETATLEMEWDADGAGRATGRMFESEQEGDLMFGDMQIDECFDGQGLLVWRQISESYRASFPEYGMGSPRDCAVDPAR
jgi:hypothetical protein